MWEFILKDHPQLELIFKNYINVKNPEILHTLIKLVSNINLHIYNDDIIGSSYEYIIS